DRPENLDLLLSRELTTPFKTKEDFLSELEAQVLFEDIGLEEALDAMRRVRNGEVMRIGLNHLSGALTPEEVSAQMTHMAEAALHTAWKVARGELKKTYTEPQGSKFAIIGLGSLGARELGLGSDLDIVFIYEPSAEGGGDKGGGEGTGEGGKKISEHEFYAKLCQRIITALTVKTREGSVFEVDTRLRPSGSAGPLVVSLPAFIKYHSASTALWERQAFIRARYVAGDEELGRGAVAEVQDLIYSYPLTEADIKEMLAIRKRMEEEIARESRDRYNFKTGRGALVDIEFLTQALQLRWGAKENKLRQPGTMEALLALVKGGHIDEADYDFLQRAYGFFRRIDMGQRIMHNRSETYLSRVDERVSPLARAMGYGKDGEGEGKKLLEDYAAITAGVREIYEKTLKGLP
ncbi:MAG: bifunctional [glutamate--ammonia ligase]-adenylyl-L-tyrosine phosphorylase/[glutamate--ammonia-ligase] adenylyltransferase, partial [Thermodesulfobacteriota bacterium]